MGRIRGFFEARGLSAVGVALWVLAAVAVIAVCVGLLGLPEGQAFPVHITEVLASNSLFPNEAGYCCDFIEIHNRADYPVELTGFQLGDIAGGSRYAFPAGTVLGPGEYLAVYCDRSIEGYADFEISRAGGESFYLIASNNAVVDSVTTVAADPDQAMALVEGQWTLTSVATPGWDNALTSDAYSDVYNSGVSPVRITELCGTGTGYLPEYDLFCDWIELHNTGTQSADISGFTLSDTVGNDKYTFPAGTVLEPGEYRVVYCSDKASATEIAAFGLSRTEAETVAFKDAVGRIVELVQWLPAESGSLALGAEGWAQTQELSAGFENTAAGHDAFLRQLGAAPGTVRISEVMAAQQLVLPDENGEFSDWVELYNTGSEAVELAGWSLSDDPREPQKWQFPQVCLGPGERMVVFCSGSFSLSSGGESVVLTSTAGNTVDSVTFPESQTNCSFIFDSGEALLTEFATPGYANDMAGYEAFCNANVPVGPLAIWEVMTANDKYLPQQLGECYDWVELKNVSGEAVALADYSITDDADTPELYRLPDRTLAPGESIVIILSGDAGLSTSRYDHAGFSLDAAEDGLLLYGPGGSLLDYVYLKDIPVGCSYGRGDSGGFCYMEPTPRQENKAGFRLISAEPVSEYTAGVHIAEGTVTLALEAPGEIYFTTDGSVPDGNSKVYTGPLVVDKTTVVRAVAIEPGKLASDVYTATFVVNEGHSLPVVSLVTDPVGLSKVYRNGDESVKEVRLAANVAYAGEDGSFSMDCETNLHGATSVVAFDKKSFTLRFEDKYDGALHYDVFEDGEVTVFRTLLLRTAHEMVYSSQMRDALMSHVASQCSDSLISQKYKYVVMYLNGEFWGIYAIREHHSAEHYASYMGVPADTVQMVRFMNDEVNSLSRFYSFCNRNSLATEENYAYAKSVLDVESFADWMIFQAYVCNVDIYENMRYYYSPEDGLWRCGLSDLDLGMPGSYRAFDELASTFHHSTAVNALMGNAEFQDLLARRLAELLAGPLSDENMIATIDKMAAEIRPEAAREEARWGTPVSGWENEVAYLKQFCDGRSKQMIDSLCRQLGFTQAQREKYFGEI